MEFGWSDRAIQHSGNAPPRLTIISSTSQWEDEIVRARCRDGKLLLHKGADHYIELPWQEHGPEQITPTRDTRLRWMQSVIGCTHYVAGAGERKYLNEADAPGVVFVQRDEISESDNAYTGSEGTNEITRT